MVYDILRGNQNSLEEGRIFIINIESILEPKNIEMHSLWLRRPVGLFEVVNCYELGI